MENKKEIRNQKANSRLEKGHERRITPFSKRSQHEMMGFVLIIIVVTVMGLVFLGFIFMKAPEKRNSAEVSNLLEASMYTTSGCVTSYVPEYKSIQRLITDTYKNPNQKCSDGRTLKSVLKTTLKNLLDQSLQVHEDGVNKAYKLKIYYSDQNRPDEELLFFEEGVFANCSIRVGGWHPIQKDAGTINVELEVCKGK